MDASRDNREKTDMDSKRFTRRVEEITFSQSEKKLKENEIKARMEEEAQKHVDALCEEIKKQDGCVLMSSGCWYWQKLDALFPGSNFAVPTATVDVDYSPQDFKSFMPGSRPLLDKEAHCLLTANFEKMKKDGSRFPFLDRGKKKVEGISCFSGKQYQKVCNAIKSKKDVNEMECLEAYCFDDPESSFVLDGKSPVDFLIMYLPIYRFSDRTDVPAEFSCRNVILSWTAHDLYPEKKGLKESLDYLKSIPKEYDWKLTKDCKIVITFKIRNDSESVRKYFDFESFKTNLLECDKKRVNLTPYDAKILTDIGRGHWELWEKPKEPSVPIKLDEKDYLVARDPKADIHWDEVIGIDFGTKSTVVVKLEKNASIKPMRVGLGDKLAQKAEERHNENPTVMEFRNLKGFRTAYADREGRPFTSWNDLMISHQAFENLTNDKSDEYHAYVSELKQWASDRKKYLIVQDHRDKKTVLEIPPYCELRENDLDPIEIYAYMLGLNINNMIQGIHLDYFLSFPVTYEKATRDLLLKSFRRGLRKSLPQSLLDDKEFVDQHFRVEAKVSEPAAYAVCALKEYGFNRQLQPGKKIAFGVFDFGGGTTDFDFGIWRRADEKERRFDNVITHYGSGGDPRLGGENILERLAYETFVQNEDLMRGLDASFICPSNCNPPSGFEKLINNRSQEAHLNTYLLMESLRDFWEQRRNPEEIFGKDNKIKVRIYNNKGEPQEGKELTIDPKMLEKIETDLISNGIDQFFHKMKQTFGEDHLLKEGLKKEDCIHIFLAGNSCKSELLKTLFKQRMEQENTALIEEYKKKYPDCECPENLYELYPPLGSEDAKKIQADRQCVSEYDVPPTGKTGVAYGLILCRSGSRIKVVDESLDKATGEIGFRYFLGYESDGVLVPLLMPDSKYGAWVDLFEAEEDTFELYYTSLAAAATGELKTSTEGVIRKRINIKPDPDACIFLSPDSPTRMAYEIAVRKDDGKPGEVRQGPRTIDLEDRR